MGNKALLYSFLIGTAGLALASVVTFVTVPVMGEAFQTSLFLNLVFGCYGMLMPLSWFYLRQAGKLRSALAELDKSHEALKEAHKELERKTNHDQMTGLLNRDSFFKEIDNRRKICNENALLMIEIDDFQTINDTWGRAAGDKALELVSDAVDAAIRAEDIVGRIGGKAFAAFLPSAPVEQANKIAERIRRSVAAIRFRPHNSRDFFELTVSVGGSAIFPVDIETADCLKSVDYTLSSAKSAGRNSCVVTSELAVFEREAA